MEELMTLGIWILGLVCLCLSVAVGFLWVLINRPAQDDPRLSKGLQILQSKIAILEDLSDRADSQVNQLVNLIEKKANELQQKIQESSRQLSLIDLSMKKSMEIAKIFEDKIPHEQIMERKNSIKYIQAAKLAHAGHTREEIQSNVDLTPAEIDFIIKVNREQLMFSEEDLPAWAQAEESSKNSTKTENTHLSTPFTSLISKNYKSTISPETHAEKVKPSAHLNELSSQELTNLGREFNRALENAEKTKNLSLTAQQLPQTFLEIPLEIKNQNKSVSYEAQTSKGKTVQIKPFNFPRIENSTE